MAVTAIDLKQALQIARGFNLAFNNAFMYGGSHQTTKDSAASFFRVLRPMLDITGSITVSVERGSVFFENHCVDKLVSVQRINNRFNKAGVQSVSFDRDASQESIQSLFFVMGSLSDFTSVDTMQAYLIKERTPGVKLNYVVYQKVTIDDAVVNKSTLSETRMLLDTRHDPGTGPYLQADPGGILREFSDMLSLRNPAPEHEASAAGAATSTGLTQADHDNFISTQIRSINRQLASPLETEDDAALTPAEMLESIYRLKENVLENIRIQKETGKLTSTGDLAINEINQISYQVIVRLIKEEYRNDRKISVKRLAQIIRRMLPDIKELKFLLPQLKDGLFAEGMSPSDYLSLVKELNKELDSDGLIQIMVEASDQIGLTFNELIEGIKEAPEESAKLIVLAAEIKKGGVKTDDQQMSAVLSDYIEKVSRTLALQSPEAAAPGGGSMLKAAVTRIEREIIDRLKAQNVASNTVAEVAQKLASQFTETISVLRGDWIRTNFNSSKKPNEETVLSIIEQVAEHGEGSEGVTEEIRAILVSYGYSAEAVNDIVKKAQLRAASAITHAIEFPPGVCDAKNTNFFLNREIKSNLRYNTPFSTILVSYEKIVDLRTFTTIAVTPDITIQLTNQSLKLLKELQKRDLDLIGIYPVNNVNIPLLVLPMTELTGALYIKKRIDKDFPCHEFQVNGLTVHVEPKVTVSSYNKKLTPDKASYLRAIYQSHCQPKLH
ncbi:MAG: hypothetical protein M0023_15605 [Desulfobacteraceae bacterium]|nr:hypothetical protein [Desulfobacteraceae bacterium]